ncbi:MAG: NtrZ family periplasmic regulatory protein [Phenylobacterium sp.]|uniref:NtrZ family periplasmic regulatory protein n=1 Tax=Phenylobacterium sp. TaxID=1871053 RepID=UPI003918AF9B
MFKRLVISAIGAALLASGASAAHAQTGKAADFTVRSETSANSQGGKSLKWDTRKGRWGVSLNVDQRTERDMQWNDVQAGAYFRVTPSLQVGGAVALGEKDGPPYKKAEPQESAPRVRLETNFKF